MPAVVGFNVGTVDLYNDRQRGKGHGSRESRTRDAVLREVWSLLRYRHRYRRQNQCQGLLRRQARVRAWRWVIAVGFDQDGSRSLFRSRKLTVAIWASELTSKSASWPGTASRLEMIDRFEVRLVCIEITVSVEENHLGNLDVGIHINIGCLARHSLALRHD